MTLRITPGAPAPVILRSLARAGWGPVSGREWQGVRSVLKALIDVLPAVECKGLATAPQLARTAGLSERWTRACLEVLEGLGVLTWRRGGIIGGRPMPSFFRVSKRALVSLVKLARRAKDAAEETHNARTRARIQALRKTTVLPKHHNRRSIHAELGASPLPLSGEGVPPNPSPEGITMLTNQKRRAIPPLPPAKPLLPMDEPLTPELMRHIATLRANFARERGNHLRAKQIMEELEATLASWSK